jgi:pyruvate/2-oxoglutarate dehydrogenase complex dihydrolipoamide dehydrogenase (E3) component
VEAHFDAIVIGAGEAGTVVAGLALDAGKRVALIYKRPYGSTCINTGCVPSKFLIHRARIAHLCRTAARFHVRTGDTSVDLKAIISEKRRLVEDHREEAFGHAREAEGLSLFEGNARFTGRRAVTVGDRMLTAETIFVATGLRPRMPDLPGLDPQLVLTNETIMELEEVPEHLIVVGGGYVGCELAQAFRRFGADVTMLHRKDRLLAREDPAVSEVVAEAFAAEDITVRLNHDLVRVRHGHGEVSAVVADPAGQEQTVTGSHLLIAAGRSPNTDTLNLAAAGVRADDAGYVVVDDFLETTARGIWAIGDVNGKQPFTRICQEEGKIAFANAFQRAGLRIERAPLGHAIFTDPQVGSVGLTEPEARADGHDVVTGTVEFAQVAMARLIGETAGLIKFVADRRTRRILGCHIVGPDAANLIYDAIIVMRRRGTIGDLALAVGIFPTLQEGVEGTARALLRTITPARIKKRRGIMEQKTTSLSCPQCNMDFKTKEELDNHNKEVHAEKKSA